MCKEKAAGDREEMYPVNLVANHPAAELLRDYGTKGCPAITGRDWTIKEMQRVIDRGHTNQH